MKRRRRSEEEDSSLELLLDTMCNTFGGVMFIAISIFVIISGMTQIENTEAQVEEMYEGALAGMTEEEIARQALAEEQSHGTETETND